MTTTTRPTHDEPPYSRKSESRASGRFAALCLAALILACWLGPPAAWAAGSLGEPIPQPELSLMEPAVQEQLREARGILDALLVDPAADPEDLRKAVGRLGLLYLVYDLPEGAAAALRNARAIEPDAFGWPYYLGVVYQESGRLDAAAEALADALGLNPGYVPARLRLGEIALAAADTATAAAHFEAALDLQPGSVAARYGLARVATLRGEPAAAVRLLREVVAAQPEAGAAHYQLGLAYRELGDLDRAREHLARHTSGEVAYPDPLLEGLGVLATGAGVHLNRANRLMREGRLEEAAAAYRAALAADPENDVARHTLATALARLGRTGEAREQLEELVRRQPEDPLARYNLGTLLAQAGEPAAAVEELGAAARLDPAHAPSHLNLGISLEELGRLAEAEAALTRAVELAPEDRLARLRLARVATRLGKGEDARRALEELLRQSPDDPETLSTLALVQEATGDLEGAAATFARVADGAGAAAERAQAAFALGNLQARTERFDDAIESYRRASSLAPEWPQPRLNLANALGRMGRFAAAAAAFGELVEAAPEVAVAWTGAATALALAGDLAGANRLVSRAVGERPNDAELLAALATLRVEGPPALRDPAAARELAGRAEATQPSPGTAAALAVAHLASGDRAEAVRWQETAVERARQAGNADLARRLGERLAAYRAGG